LIEKRYDIKILKTDVVKAAKWIFHKGLVDIGEGNVSVRIPNKDELLITPTFNDYENITENEIVHLGFEEKEKIRVDSASTEYKLHVMIYKARTNAQAIIHTHSTYATMLSVIRKKIPIIMEEMVILLGGDIKVSDFKIAHTKELGINAIDKMGEANAVLLANHGVLVCGRNIDFALKAAELVEKIAKIYWGSLQIGDPMEIPNEAFNKFKNDFNLKFSTY
jgi:L-ribulose-5-phosphate 4-epimerase